MKYLLIINLFLGLCMSNTSVAQQNAQNIHRTIILINGTAHIADVAMNGSIVSKYQAVHNLFQTNTPFAQIIAEAERKGLQKEGSIELYDDPIEPLYADQYASNPSAAQSADESYTVDAPSSSLNNMYIAFNASEAVLNQSAIEQLLQISKAYDEGLISQIAIFSYHRDVPESRVLAQNRSAAIRDLLLAYGVNNAIIQTNLPYGADANSLQYVYVQSK